MALESLQISLRNPETDSDIKPLDTKGSSIEYPEVHLIGTPGDGACFFHSIVQAFHEDYIDGYDKSRKAVFDSVRFIKQLRTELSDGLDEKVDPQNEESPTWYDSLSRGNLRELSKEMPHYKLENMKKELKKYSAHVDNLYLEYMCKRLDLDIYVIDGKTMDVVQADKDLLYEGRRSIVIYFENSHYVTVCIKRGDFYTAIFNTTDEFIETLKRSLYNV